jgi:hypothetical protein
MSFSKMFQGSTQSMWAPAIRLGLTNLGKTANWWFKTWSQQWWTGTSWLKDTAFALSLSTATGYLP